MIETPVKAPPPTGPPAAPPPDVRTRVMDPPPDPGARHLHACEECGTPLHPEQAACLSCGTMVDRDSGVIGAGIRRAALGSATALLVLGCAVGAAVAGLPHGKHVGRGPIAKVVGPKALPPATGGSNTGSGSGNSPLADSGTGTKPPALAPTAPKSDNAPKFPKAPSSSGGGGGGGSSPGTGGTTPNTSSGSDDGGSGTQGSNQGDQGDQGDQGGQGGQGGHPKTPHGLSKFNTGQQPDAAHIFTSSGESDGAGTTIDGNTKTAWTTSRSKIGVEVDPPPYTYRRIGILSATPGWSLEVYYTTKTSPAGYPSPDWKPVGSTNATGKDDLPLDGEARHAKHYLVWVANTGGKHVRINEIQLMEK